MTVELIVLIIVGFSLVGIMIVLTVKDIWEGLPSPRFRGYDNTPKLILPSTSNNTKINQKTKKLT